MKHFRVVSDLHIDINERHPISFKDKDVFTVICGDTSGFPKKTIEWIKVNCPNGVGVSGNHLPYNYDNKPIQTLREELATAFPVENSFTYLDVETGAFSKVVDGIMFIGSCMYTDMSVKHREFNPDGEKTLNMRCSRSHMNDYKWGIKSIDADGKHNMIFPSDYLEWFKNAYQKIEDSLNENESKDNPLPVVLLTHHPLITDYFDHNDYMDRYVWSLRDYNWPSYASDMSDWLMRHSSIKCYCCGHIHAVEKELRNIEIVRPDGSSLLIVNNARGYVDYGHDEHFNPELMIDVENWKIVK